MYETSWKAENIMLTMKCVMLLSKGNDSLQSQCHASHTLPVTQCKSRKSVCGGGGHSNSRCNGGSIIITVLIFGFWIVKLSNETWIASVNNWNKTRHSLGRGGNLWWTSIPSRGEYHTQCMWHTVTFLIDQNE